MTGCYKEAAIAAARTVLEKVPGALDEGSGRRAIKFHLMCMAGLGTPLDVDASDPMRDWEFTGERSSEVVERAMAGDSIAHDALCAIADNLTTRSKTLPKALQEYIVSTARDGMQRKRGQHPGKNTCRDFGICLAVKCVTELGLDATRSPATADKNGRECGCSITALALHQLNLTMSEGAIKKIWDKRNRPLFNGFTVGN